MQEVTEKTDTRLGLNQIVARVAVFALLTGIPLFMTNKYFNITISKFLFFAAITTLSFVLCLFLKGEKQTGESSRPHKSMDIAVFGFLGASLFSVLFSEYRVEAFLGSAGRSMGFCFVLLLAGLYYMVSRNYIVHEGAMLGYFAVFLIVAFLAFLQFFGVNIFGLYDGVTQQTIDNYYSTIGNINVVSSYICLCVPFIMYAFCFTTRIWKRCMLFVLCFFGFCFLVIANSDSGYLGICAAFWMLGIFLTRKRKYFHKLLFLGSAFLFSTRFVCFLSRTFETKELSPLAILLGESDIILIIAVALLVLGILLINVRISRPVMGFIKTLFIVVPIVLVLVLVGVIVYYSVYDTKTDLGELKNYLRFNDSWATGRGQIWRMTMESYSDFPIIRKLFGCGPDTLVLVLKDRFGEEMLKRGALADNAHNEFMNYLVNHGIVGLGFYISIVAVALRNCYLKRENGMLYKGLFLVIFSYLCQSVVNISQPLTTPFFFVLVFISCCDYVKTKKIVIIEEEMR